MIIVVGAGLVGSCLVRHLKARGREYVHVGDGRPDSVAALALLRRAYHKDGELALFDRTLELYAEWGIPVAHGGMVTNYRTPDKPPRLDKDWRVVHPSAPLLDPQIRNWAKPGTYGVDIPGGPQLSADVVLWATGINGGTGITYGVTYEHSDPDALSERGLRLHHYAPYKTIAAGVVGGHVRLGSSSAKTEEKAREQAADMLAACYKLGIVTTLDGWSPVLGRRAHGTEAVQLPPGHRIVNGFHRTGYALAPAVTERIVEEL